MTREIKKRIESIRRGEVPEGYKKTAFGVFPCDWKYVSLGGISVGKGEYGINAPATSFVPMGHKYLRITDINDEGKYVFSGAFVANENSSNFLLKLNDIVFARTGASVGKTYLYNPNDGQLVYAGFLIRFHIKETYNAYLVSAICKTKAYWDWVGLMSVRSGQPGINAEEYASFRFVVPKCFAEQQKIAEILQAQDRVIGLKERLLVQKQQQKKYLMQQLLTGKIRLPGFTGEWRQVALKNFLKERKVYSSKGKEYPHVTLSNQGIYPKSERYNRDHLVRTNDKQYKITHYGDICYNPANLKFGAISINTFGSAIFSPIYVTFEVKKDADLWFLGELMTSKRFLSAVRKYEEGTVYERMAVKPSDLLLHQVFVPSLEEQTAIAEVLSTADAEIGLLKKDIEQEKLKKKSLMQLLLTGIVRV